MDQEEYREQDPEIAVIEAMYHSDQHYATRDMIDSATDLPDDAVQDGIDGLIDGAVLKRADYISPSTSSSSTGEETYLFQRDRFGTTMEDYLDYADGLAEALDELGTITDEQDGQVFDTLEKQYAAMLEAPFYGQMRSRYGEELAEKLLRSIVS